MSVLHRTALEESPLADLHAIASELSIDGYRRLRKGELVDAILARQGADEQPTTPQDAPPVDEGAVPVAEPEAESEGSEASEEGEDERGGARRRRGRRGGRGRSGGRQAPRGEEDHEEGDADEGTVQAEDEVEGVVELLPNGSGFIRVDPPEPSDEDVYISSTQVKRCELVSGDRISGPRRAPRRSERFSSLVRIDTVNGRPAAEIADGVRFDDLPAAFPDERFRLGSEDPTVKAIEWLTPFGKGSRVTIVGPARSGKTEALRRLAGALAGLDEVELSLVLAGVRPEEISEWSNGPLLPAASVGLGASAEAQANAVEPLIDQARRLASRGQHVVVLIDTLDGLHLQAARKLLAAARNLVQGGSLSVIATATAPIGGETTVISLDVSLTSTGRYPALDLATSGTIRPELLVGEAGAEAIARARSEALNP
ncbi:MAG: Rho termination factor N-terminal domain-containing protein [Solirubrobacterales bacterium]|nr:Rho termination factor N-terminal domain-containing protein [Solirubrobacterales bacterium]